MFFQGRRCISVLTALLAWGLVPSCGARSNSNGGDADTVPDAGDADTVPDAGDADTVPDGAICDRGAVHGIHIEADSEIDSMERWSGYTAVTTSVVIFGAPSLRDVDGLECLETIGGALEVNANAILANLDGLANLATVGHEVVIGWGPADRNEALTNIDGLANLTTVGESLRVSDNPVLANVNGLRSLTHVGGSLDICR